MTNIVFEHRYWLRILRDHMSFIQAKLSVEHLEEHLGTFSPLLIDHMLREEAYYLMKLGINVGNRPLEDLVE